jgi:hypothetical protein
LWVSIAHPDIGLGFVLKEEGMSMKRSPVGIKSMLGVALVLGCLMPMDVIAQTPFYVNFKAGVYSPQSSGLDGYDTGFNGEIALGFRFSPNFAGEFGIGYFNTQGRRGYYEEDFDIDVVPLTLTLKAILPYKRWEFFGLAGGGVYFVSGPYNWDSYDYDHHHYYNDYDYDSDTIWGGYLGAGINYNLTSRIFVGVEGKYLWTEEAHLDDEEFGYPVDFRFKLDGVIFTGVLGIRF